jgi:hypothetical protein
MGTITRSFANNIGTSGILKAGAFNNASLNNVTALNASVATGNMVLISSQTASNSASISFTTGITSTYKEYQFYFINCRPATDNVNFSFNLSTDGGSNYNVTKTTTYIVTFANEANNDTVLAYDTAKDSAQDTGFANFVTNQGNGADECFSGLMQLFNPASTTYVKHFITNTNGYLSSDYSVENFIAGYGNTTSAINAIQFKYASGNIADGTILMYGIK